MILWFYDSRDALRLDPWYCFAKEQPKTISDSGGDPTTMREYCWCEAHAHVMLQLCRNVCNAWNGTCWNTLVPDVLSISVQSFSQDPFLATARDKKKPASSNVFGWLKWAELHWAQLILDYFYPLKSLCLSQSWTLPNQGVQSLSSAEGLDSFLVMGQAKTCAMDYRMHACKYT